MSTRYADLGKYKLAYTKFGEGNKALLCFHGYGLDKDIFKLFEKSLTDQYTFYTFDLPFHGETIWPDNESPVTKDLINQVISSFLRDEKIEKFSMIGFSMGAKFTMTIYEAFHNKTDKLVFIAPDGIKYSFFYSIATYNTVVRRLFRIIVHNPLVLTAVVRILIKLKLGDPGIMRYTLSELSTLGHRQRLYHTWVSLKDLKFDMDELAILINSEETKVVFITGRQDKVIRTKNMKPLESKLAYSKHIVLNCGHTNIMKILAESDALKTALEF